MCVLCERAALALGDSVLPNNLLIDSANVVFSQGRVASDGVMDLYLHASGGAVQVSGGGVGAQTIESVPIPQQDQDYIGSIVRRLDAIIDLDFRFVADPGQADVAFYYDTEIEIGGGGQTLGLATKGSAGWELFINQPAVASNQDYRQYVNLHEWGHALGLEHPFEAGDGDVYAGSTNPWTSAYPEETVMAYRRPLNSEWPDFFSTSDLNALIEVWGRKSIGCLHLMMYLRVWSIRKEFLDWLVTIL
jgi:serralysin